MRSIVSIEIEGPMNSLLAHEEHVWCRVIADLYNKNYINSEDVERLATVIALLVPRKHNLLDAMEHQHDLQLTAGFYCSYANDRLRCIKADIDRRYYVQYNHMNVEKRVPEAKVRASLRESSPYMLLLEQERTWKYFCEQLSELRSACLTRMQMLQQLSNNARLQAKHDLEDSND